jgi:Aspartyl protease/SEC-C motif
MVQIINDHRAKSFTVDFKTLVNAIIIKVGITPYKPFEDIKDSEIVYYNSLWDTGATNSVVTKATAKELGLVSTGKTRVFHAGGESTVNVFFVNIFLPNKIIFPLRVTECDDSTNFGLIIGMDIITQGDFSITNTNSRTAVSFRVPSLEKIDYVKLTPNTQLVQKPIIVEKKQQRNGLCACGSNLKYKNCCGKDNLSLHHN